LRRFEYGRFL